jgi:DnaJ homolog subfamily C member 28
MTDIDDAIKKAMQAGQFDDLPGKGKPLNLDENPLADPEWELAHHVLKSGGFTLPWIETRQQIEKELAEALANLKRAWEWKQSAAAQIIPPAQVELQWQQGLSAFREKVISLNKRIRDYNLEAPADRFHLLVLNGDKEIEAIVST